MSGDLDESERSALIRATTSVKFMVPGHDGISIDDPGLRGIDEDLELGLPFPVIALEHRNIKGSRAIVFAEDDGEFIRVTSALEMTNDLGKVFWWSDSAYRLFPKVGYLDRRIKGNGGFPGINSYEEGEPKSPDLNWHCERVLLSFLNALACSNVRTERIEPAKQPTKKAALPFDSYHILTIASPNGTSSGGSGTSGDHRSPREHLRRGHIRRYETGLKIWVNAHVVSAGVGGKVVKDYRLAA